MPYVAYYSNLSHFKWVRLVGPVSNLAQNEIKLILVDIIVQLGSTVSTVYTPSILVDPAPTHTSHLAFYRCLLERV
jgi:hypothetical protein